MPGFASLVSLVSRLFRGKEGRKEGSKGRGKRKKVVYESKRVGDVYNVLLPTEGLN